jgi:hypothetical protein
LWRGRNKNLSNPVVAATFEKAKTDVFAEFVVWNREFGGSNPSPRPSIIGN